MTEEKWARTLFYSTRVKSIQDRVQICSMSTKQKQAVADSFANLPSKTAIFPKLRALHIDCPAHERHEHSMCNIWHRLLIGAPLRAVTFTNAFNILRCGSECGIMKTVEEAAPDALNLVRSKGPWGHEGILGLPLQSNLQRLTLNDRTIRVADRVVDVARLSGLRELVIHPTQAERTNYGIELEVGALPHLQTVDIDLGLARVLFRDIGARQSIKSIRVACSVTGTAFSNREIVAVQEVVNAIGEGCPSLDTFILELPKQRGESEETQSDHSLSLAPFQNCTALRTIIVHMNIRVFDCRANLYASLVQHWPKLEHLEFTVHTTRGLRVMMNMGVIIALCKHCKDLRILKVPMLHDLEGFDLEQLGRLQHLKILDIEHIPKKRNKDDKFLPTVRGRLFSLQ